MTRDPLNSNDAAAPQVLSLSFNQDGECFACGHQGGFRLFNSQPLRQIGSEDARLNGGGVRLVEMLFRCNYVALVGGGAVPAFPDNKVVVWDCSLGKSVIELEMATSILAVRLRRDRIVIVLGQSIAVYSFSDIPVELCRLDTRPNPNGLCTLSSSTDRALLAFPSQKGVGVIEVVDLQRRGAGGGGGGGGQQQEGSICIMAHSHELQAMCLNIEGTMLVSASERGTLIRVFDASSGAMLREFRRGSNPARISCIKFSFDSMFICVSSNHSTLHVFSFARASKNPRLRKVERYLKGGDVSFSRLRIGKPDEKEVHISQCAFDKSSENIIVDGSYYAFSFDKLTGRCSQKAYCLFTELNSNR